MRQLVTNPRLLLLLKEIEGVLGYEIQSLPMPEIHEQVAEGCSLSLTGDGFAFLCRPNHIPPNDILCHELMHILLYIDGFPGFGIPSFFEEGYAEHQILSLFSNLALHLKVWQLTEAYGFSEMVRYSHSISSELIPKIEARALFTECPPAFVKGGVAAYLANGFLCPCVEETKSFLREVAKTSYPQSIEPADAICHAYAKALPLTPRSCCEATFEALGIIGVPRGYLRPGFSSQPRPGFLAKVFEMSAEQR